MNVRPTPPRLVTARAPGHHRLAVITAGAVAIASALMALAIPQAADAAITAKWGYVYANLPSAASYTPDLNHQLESNGQHVHVTRTSVGDYNVLFRGLNNSGVHGVFQVTAFGGQGTCQLGGVEEFGPADVSTEVLCFDLNGQLADHRFEASYTHATGTDPLAYAVVGQGFFGVWGFDGRGGTVTADHTGTGTSTVHFPGLAGRNGTVKVSPWDGRLEILCDVVSWGGGDVDVACTDRTGRPVDTDFTITFVVATSILGVPRTSGYVLNLAPALTYVDSNLYAYNSTGHQINVNHLTTGVYQVIFHGFSLIRGVVHVTAFQSVAIDCNVTAFGGAQGTEAVTVRCYDMREQLTDSRFTMQFGA